MKLPCTWILSSGAGEEDKEIDSNKMWVSDFGGMEDGSGTRYPVMSNSSLVEPFSSEATEGEGRDQTELLAVVDRGKALGIFGNG